MAFASVLASFVAIEQDEEDEIILDGPRILAAVESMRWVVITGTYLYLEIGPSDKNSGGIYGSKEEADRVARFLETLESYAGKLGQQVGRLAASRPLAGRAECHLTCLKSYSRFLKANAAKLAGIRSTKSVQSSLKAFYAAKGEDSDDESDDEGSHPVPMEED
jgi:hypothetical protein